MGCRFSNWAISASVQLWKPSDFTRIARTSRVGSSARKPISTACFIIARTALRNPFALSGFWARAAISLTTCSRCSVAARLSPCSVTFLVCLPTEPIDDVAVDRLSARLHRSECDRVVVAHRERADRARLYALAPDQQWLTSERFLVGPHVLGRPR